MGWFRRRSIEPIERAAGEDADRLFQYVVGEAPRLLAAVRGTGEVADDADQEAVILLSAVLAHFRDRATAAGFKELGSTYQRLYMSHFCLALASKLTELLQPRLGEPLLVLHRKQTLHRIDDLGRHLSAIDPSEVLSEGVVLEGAYCITKRLLGSVAESDQAQRKAQVLRMCISSITGLSVH